LTKIDPIYISKAELSQITGKSERTLENLSSVLKTVPNPKRKGSVLYDLTLSLVGLIEHYSERANSKFIPKDLEEARTKQIATKIEIDEIKLAVMRGDVHTTENIEKALGAILTRLRVNLLGIPMGVAPALTGKDDINEIADIIDDRITRALYEIVNFDVDSLYKDSQEGLVEQDEEYGDEDDEGDSE